MVEEAYDFLVIWMIWGSSRGHIGIPSISRLIDNVLIRRRHGKQNPNSLGRKLFPVILYNVGSFFPHVSF